MTAKLFIQAIIKFLAGFILIGLLIFLPAGTFSFFNGWLFMIIFLSGMLSLILIPTLIIDYFRINRFKKGYINFYKFV